MEGARSLAVAELQHQGRDWGWQVPPTWSRLFMDAHAACTGPGSAVERGQSVPGGPIPAHLANASTASCSSGLPLRSPAGGTSACGEAPSRYRSTAPRLGRYKGGLLERGCRGAAAAPPAQHLLLPSSFTRDTSKLFLRGGRGLMSTGRWAMAPRRASLTAAALRPNTRQLLLWGHGGQRPGGHPRTSHHRPAPHQCSMTTRGPTSPGLPSS